MLGLCYSVMPLYLASLGGCPCTRVSLHQKQTEREWQWAMLVPLSSSGEKGYISILTRATQRVCSPKVQFCAPILLSVSGPSHLSSYPADPALSSLCIPTFLTSWGCSQPLLPYLTQEGHLSRAGTSFVEGGLDKCRQKTP